MIESKISQQRKKVSNFNQGGIAKGCGGVMENKRKKTKYSNGKKGLKTWVKEKWVDIGAPKKNGKYQPCGRSKGAKENIRNAFHLQKPHG